MATRDLEAEKYAIGVFGGKEGRLPSSSEDWASVHQIAYPGGLPEELIKVDEASTAAAGLGTSADTATPPTATPSLAATGAYGTDASKMNTAQTALEEARGAFSKMTGPNQAYNVLQEALKAKIGAPQQTIGESSISKAAGVSGFGALGQNLAGRAKELRIEQTRLQNLATTLAGTYKDEYNAAMTEIETAAALYEFEANRFDAAEAIVQQSLNQLKMLETQTRLSEESQKRLMAYEAALAGQAGNEVLSIDEAIKLGLPYGTTRSQAIAMGVDLGAEADEATIEALQAKADLIDELLESKGLAGSVGAYGVSRWTPFSADKAARADFAAGVQQLISKETLDALLALKAGGGTLGALSDSEGDLLRNAASKIGSWIMKDENGNPTGEFEISEELFKKELNKIKTLTNNALNRAKGTSDDEEGNPFGVDLSGWEPTEEVSAVLESYTRDDGTQLSDEEVDYLSRWWRYSLNTLVNDGGFELEEARDYVESTISDYVDGDYGSLDEDLSTSENGSIVDVSLGDKTIQVSDTIADRLAMADADYFAATGRHIQVSEGVRSHERQAELYARYKSGKGGRAAPPGQSFHETGNAIDVSGDWKAAEPFLHKYGFMNELADDKHHFSIGEFS